MQSRFDRYADNRFRRNRRYCRFNRKVITEKAIVQATTRFAKWLEVGLIVFLMKVSIALTDTLVRNLRTT